MITDRSFSNMFARTRAEFATAPKVHTERWQGNDISKRPEMVSYELLNWHCNVGLDWVTQLAAPKTQDWSHPSTLSGIADVIQPNLPWADDHFLERVGGEPLNPGEQWANWPWADSAAKHHVEGGKFNHTYMERLWPKWAGMTTAGVIEKGSHIRHVPDLQRPLLPQPGGHHGIRHGYGDLEDLVDLLANEPLTRQAWIPLFFPEDTGVGDGGRKPCTLGYQFIMRDNALSIYYPLRSCDFVRHFRDDIYLAIRLLLWVLDRCRERRPDNWENVVLGYYAMHCTSLHIFENDHREMFG